MAANTSSARTTPTAQTGEASTEREPSFQVLGKGRVPYSGPSHRGHGVPNFRRHLLRKDFNSDRNSRRSRSVQSAPSPEVGD